jgi:hypothetical protein
MRPRAEGGNGDDKSWSDAYLAIHHFAEERCARLAGRDQERQRVGGAPGGFADGEVGIVRDNTKQLKFKAESTGFAD